MGSSSRPDTERSSSALPSSSLEIEKSGRATSELTPQQFFALMDVFDEMEATDE